MTRSASEARPLDDVYAIVHFEAVRAKVRDEGLVRNKAVYLGIGATCAGRKDVLVSGSSRPRGRGSGSR